MNNDRTSQDAQWSRQRNLAVGDVDLGDSAVIGHNVAQVSGVSLSSIRGTMFLAVRIEVRSGGGASVGVVTELVDVESVIAWLQSSHFTSNLDRIGISILLEKDCTLDIAAQNANCFSRHFVEIES